MEMRVYPPEPLRQRRLLRRASEGPFSQAPLPPLHLPGKKITKEEKYDKNLKEKDEKQNTRN
jgi:hypothetical protein